MDFSSLSKNIPLKLYNTKSRQKEVLSPHDKKIVRMYTCGPTTYDYAHIGNFRTYVFEDLLRRTIKFLGMPVKQVMNITDIDDKTIKGALKHNLSLDEYTAKFKKAFFDDLNTLNIESAEEYPEATKYVDKMIVMIQALLDRGVAYKTSDGSVYYSINKFEKYGALSHLKLDELKPGASNRTDSDEYEKDSVSDFALWKRYDESRDGNIFWESPFGKGRPGWHLECSCMALNILGSNIDIHAGGVDNIFPHHENEIAQAESYSGENFVNLWVHSEHLIVDNKKMSKSLGNFYTLRDLLDKGYSGREVRYLLLQTHYKTQLNFTFEGVDAAKASLERIDDFILRLQNYKNDSSKIDIIETVEDFFIKFAVALADDLNVSSALSVIFDLIRHVNALCDDNKISSEDAVKTISLMKSFDSILGVIFTKTKEISIPKEVTDALQNRENARKNKNWAEADRLRDFITDSGYRIEDSDQGPRLKKN